MPVIAALAMPPSRQPPALPQRSALLAGPRGDFTSSIADNHRRSEPSTTRHHEGYDELHEFDQLIDDVRCALPARVDACVSFVLFENDRQEVINAIAQVRSRTVTTHVVIIDNSVPPMDLSFAAAMGATVVATNQNIGYGRGHNIALAASRGRCRYNIVMNTDLQTQDDVIGGMVAFMDRHGDAGLAMPRVRYPDGSLQRLCRLLPDPADIVARRLLHRTKWGQEKNRQYEFHNWNYDTVAEFPFLSGCFMILRRETLDQVGYFDERYFLYAEDLDLSRRIRAVSRTLYNPDETVVHEYRSKARPSLKRVRYAMVSLSKYFFKWGWIVDPERDRINRAAIEQFR
ncbi:glycosyltransferase [Sphingomonas sp. 179-A 2A2 NHS]|uniref:glycosyltransferase n=1 Tax=Sphingomonas sp. 179-A 2A2 NHS TaxID=3374290 RepID=UPI00387A815F